MSNRKITVSGEINETSFTNFSSELELFERPPFRPVQLHLISDGGDAYSALAFYDRMVVSPCPIHVHAYGLVASAAVLILAAGAKRYMGESAWVMVHEDHGDTSGNVSYLEIETAHLRSMENQWNDLMAKHTAVDAAGWAKFHKRTTYLSYVACISVGLVDGPLPVPKRRAK